MTSKIVWLICVMSAPTAVKALNNSCNFSRELFTIITKSLAMQLSQAYYLKDLKLFHFFFVSNVLNEINTEFKIFLIIPNFKRTLMERPFLLQKTIL